MLSNQTHSDYLQEYLLERRRWGAVRYHENIYMATHFSLLCGLIPHLEINVSNESWTVSMSRFPRVGPKGYKFILYDVSCLLMYFHVLTVKSNGELICFFMFIFIQATRMGESAKGRN